MLALSAMLATLALASFALPGRLWLLALGFGVAAVGAGLSVYRREAAAGRRLRGALCSFVGGVAVLFAATKVAVTLAAIHHIAAMM